MQVYSMAEFQLPKLATRVRFPSPAPNKNADKDTICVFISVLALVTEAPAQALVQRYCCVISNVIMLFWRRRAKLETVSGNIAWKLSKPGL